MCEEGGIRILSLFLSPAFIVVLTIITHCSINPILSDFNFFLFSEFEIVLYTCVADVCVRRD